MSKPSDWPEPRALSLPRANGVRRSIQQGKLLYRGVRDGRWPSDPGDLGIGTYYSSSAIVARCYGKLTKQVISLKNPLVLSSEVAYEIIAERCMTCRGTNAARTVGATTATRMLQCLGYDGVVAVHAERTREWEVVVFPNRKN